MQTDKQLIELERKFHAKRAALDRANTALSDAERAGGASNEFLQKLEAASDSIHEELFEILCICAAIPAVSDDEIAAKATVLLEYSYEDDVLGELTRSLCLDIVNRKAKSKVGEAAA